MTFFFFFSFFCFFPNIACLAGFYFSFYFWKRVRIIEDAPTAKVRSAHQGYIELEGEARLMEGEPIFAPLTHHKCVWFRYKIERKDSHYRNEKWLVVKKATSGNLFQLVDETGVCLVDPEDAEVSSDEKTVWYGSSEWPVSAPSLSGGSRFSMGTDRYRYTEWLILPNQPLYAMGEFRTVTATANYSMRDVTRDLIRNWKKDQANLMPIKTDKLMRRSGSWYASRPRFMLKLNIENYKKKRLYTSFQNQRIVSSPLCCLFTNKRN